MKLIDIAEKGDPLAKSTDEIWTTTIMTYELGSLIRALVRARRRKEAGNERGMRAYLAEARIELADLITQTEFLAEQMGWKLVDIENDGRNRFIDRMMELAAIQKGREKC